MEKKEENARDTTCQRKLNYNAPLLSTRRPSGATSLQLSRTSSQVAWRDNCNSVPFSWEQIPGKPKDSEANDHHDLVVPPPKLPPGRWQSPEEAGKLIHIDHCCHDVDNDDGFDGDIDDIDHDACGDDIVFSDAIDMFSLSESVELKGTSDNTLPSVNMGAQSPSFIIQRFLTDANALAASSALRLSQNSNQKLAQSSEQRDKCVSRSIKQMNPLSQGCGFDIFFPWSWRMKHKPCCPKTPAQQATVKAKSQEGARRKQKL